MSTTFALALPLRHTRAFLPLLARNMSLVETGYSSDEDVATDDAFGLAQLPNTKKARTAPEPPTVITAAAPHVLSEVGRAPPRLRAF
jgi:hypothetical protein